MGLAVQVAGLLFGVGAVFASSARMSSYWRMGSMMWQEKFCMVGAGYLGYEAGRQVSVRAIGDSAAYRNHWGAYTFVKSCNRWEGRMILGKKPTY